MNDSQSGTTNVLTSAASLGCAPGNTEKNGAYANQYGQIYIRIMDRTDDGHLTYIDYGLASIAEAICIRDQLNTAISHAADLATGRCKGA
jgi:hypothetical protein